MTRLTLCYQKKAIKKRPKSFFRCAIGYAGRPQKVTIDKSGSNNSTLQSINNELRKSNQVLIRQVKYLNNINEPDYRFIKKITNPMLGFQSYASAHATLMGIELHHMLHKGQHTNSKNMPVFEQFYALAAYDLPKISAPKFFKS